MIQSRYNQGRFTPRHPEKYIGNTKQVPYLSDWEYRLFHRLDESKHVKAWNANALCIPYIFEVDGRQHRYYLDALAKISDESGAIITYIIEVKPDAQLQAPPQPKRKHPKAMESYQRRVKDYIKNCNKWKAAADYAKTNNYIFLIISEKAYYVFDGALRKIKDNRNF